MRRTWIVVFVALFVAIVARDAHAFHAGTTFVDPPGAGGGGGIYYLGVKAERGWTCVMCHTEAPGDIKVALSSDPPELLADYLYEPGIRYEIEVDMVALGEGGELGQGNPISNYNSLGFTVTDSLGLPLGKPSGAADEFQEINFTTLLSVGTAPGQAHWTFAWTAPADAGTGPATIYLGVVDGNGGGITGSEAFTDPFGDDVVMVEIPIDEIDAQARVESQGDARVPAIMEPERSASRQQFGLGAEVMCFVGLLIASASRRRPSP